MRVFSCWISTWPTRVVDSTDGIDLFETIFFVVEDLDDLDGVVAGGFVIPPGLPARVGEAQQYEKDQ